MLILKDGAGLHPEAQAVGPSLLRALQMPQKAAFKRHLLNSVELQSLRSKGGLYLGQVPTNPGICWIDRGASSAITAT